MTEVNKTKLREKILRSKELTALEKRYLEGLVNASDWIPCSERMPEEINGKSRIVFASVRHIDTVNLQITWTERGKWYTSGTVTHWMPLPSLPEVTANVE